MYLFERAYRDYASRLVQFNRSLWRHCGTIWKWFWDGPGANVLEVVLRVGVVISGIVVGVLYVSYERRQGRGISLGAVLAFCLIAGYVSVLMWGWKAPVHFAARLTSAACAAGAVALLIVGAVTFASVVFTAYLIVLFLLTALSFIVFVPMRALHWLWLLWRRITYECPYDNCSYQGLPVHICGCGKEYDDLRPSFYGIFHHVCDHGNEKVKLPTMDFLGRSRLLRRCAHCGSYLIHSSIGELSERPVFMAGGPSAGKSAFLFQAMHQLSERLNALPGSRVCIDSEEQGRLINDELTRLGRGEVPAKTIVGGNVHAYGLAVRLREPRRLRCLLYLFDPPGEDFTSMRRLGSKRVMQHLGGIVLLVDPFCTPKLAEHARHVGREMKVSNVPLGDVVGELMGAARQWLLSGSSQKSQVPLAIVLAKADALPEDDCPFLANLCPTNGSADPDADSDRCREALIQLGEGHSLRVLEQRFTNVRYFACSALGRTPTPGDTTPFRAAGVTEPLLWMLGLNGSSGRKRR